MIVDFSHAPILMLLFATGIAAGSIDAIAGGGGLISLPILLSIGMPPHIALGTNKFQSFSGTLMATYSYYRHGWLDPKKLAYGLFFGFIGSVIGAIVTQLMSGEILKKIIPAILVLILIYTLFSPQLGLHERFPRMKENRFYLIFGLILGFYDGFIGPGAGALWTFALMFFLGFNLLKATAYTKAFNLNTNIAALFCFIIAGNIDYSVALIMGAGQLIGGRLGARLAIKKGAAFIRPVFMFMMFATIATLVYKDYISRSVILSAAKDLHQAAETQAGDPSLRSG